MITITNCNRILGNESSHRKFLRPSAASTAPQNPDFPYSCERFVRKIQQSPPPQLVSNSISLWWVKLLVDTGWSIPVWQQQVPPGLPLSIWYHCCYCVPLQCLCTGAPIISPDAPYLVCQSVLARPAWLVAWESVKFLPMTYLPLPCTNYCTYT